MLQAFADWLFVAGLCDFMWEVLVLFLQGYGSFYCFKKLNSIKNF
jgi:hypothetical protein